MKKLLLIFTVLLLNTNPLFSQDYWEVMNTPAGIDLYSMDVNSNGTIYLGLIGASGGGVLKSDDGGLTWVNTGLSNSSLRLITITSDDIIYAGSGNVFRSINNGDSWDTISPALYPGILFVSNNSHVFAGFWGGLYKSDSIGTDWELVLQLQNYEVVNAIIEDVNSGVLYAGTTNFISGGGVYRSFDGGDTWDLFGLTDHYVTSLAMNAAGDLFAGTRGQNYLSIYGVYVLPNGQTEWVTLINNELVTTMLINSEDAIFIGCSSQDYFLGGVRRSMDNGQSWEDISSEAMHDFDVDDLVLGPQEHLYTLERNSPTPIYKSANSTIIALSDNPLNKKIITNNNPNPFSNETSIRFELPFHGPGEVQISIYNSQGNKIEDIMVPNISEGEQSIIWNAKGLPAGLYYYTLSAGGIHTSGKMVLQK